MAPEKRIVLVHLSEIISDYFVVGTDGGKPSPFLASVFADGNDNGRAHLVRLTPLLFNEVNAAIAEEREIPSALATSSAVT